MSARAIVAAATTRGFLGVTHDLASEPWNLGNALLMEILDREGDLASLANDLVFLAPGGWRSFPQRKRRPEPEDLDEPLLYGPDELRGQAWLGWFYVLDVAGRKLTVFPGNPFLQRESRVPPLARVLLDDKGLGRPPVFAQPPPPWPGLPVSQGWTQDDPDLRRARERLDRALSGPDGGQALRLVLAQLLRQVVEGVPFQAPADLESPSERALRERLDHARTDPRRRSVQPEDPICVPFNWDNTDSYWEADLAGLPLRYPPAGLRQGDEPIRLYRLDGGAATLRDLEGELLERAKAAPSTALQRFSRSMAFWRGRDDGPLEAVHSFIDALRLVRGSTEGLHWWLLDWLRMGALPLPEERPATGPRPRPPPPGEDME